MSDLIKTANDNYYHPTDPGEGAYRNSPPRLSVTEREREMLKSIARERRVLEIGTGLGVSTRAIMETAQSVTTVDPDKWVHESIWPTLPEGVTTVASLDGVEPWFDMVFVDGDHHYKSVVADLRMVEPLALPFAPVIVHDYNLDGVRSALDESNWKRFHLFDTACHMILGFFK